MKITPKQCLDGVTIELNVMEARLLRGIMRSVTGEMSGPRLMTDEIQRLFGTMGIGAFKVESHTHLPDYWCDLESEMDDDLS